MKCKLTSLLGAFALVASMQTADAADVTFRMHQFLPPQATLPANGLMVWAQKVEKESAGRIKVQHFPSMQLGGKPPDLYDQAKDGVVDIVWTVLGYTPGRFPKTEAFELPFMSGSAEASSKAFQEFVQKNAMDEFKDVKVIAVHTHGPGWIHSKTPITKLEDLKGMKVRGGSRVINIMLEQLGATPVGMPVPAVGEALSKGVIDATTIPWEVVPSVKVQQIVKNHTGFTGDKGLYTQTFVVAMNKGSYNKLPARSEEGHRRKLRHCSGRHAGQGHGRGRQGGAVAGAKGRQQHHHARCCRDRALATCGQWCACSVVQGGW